MQSRIQNILQEGAVDKGAEGRGVEGEVTKWVGVMLI